MKFAQIVLIFVFCSCVLFFNACAENKNENRQLSNANQTYEENTNLNPAKDDIDALGKIIKLPLTPEEAVWREDYSGKNNPENRAPSPNDKKLVAVLKYSQFDANQISAQAEKYKAPIPADIDPENWFPAELIAKSQLSGDETLKGLSYAANDFFQSPFINGKITRVSDTDFFVLELASF